jgi:hypothetical protein
MVRGKRGILNKFNNQLYERGALVATLKKIFFFKKSCNLLSESVSVRASFEEKEASVLALALTLALFSTLLRQGFGGHSTPNGQKLQPGC